MKPLRFISDFEFRISDCSRFINPQSAIRNPQSHLLVGAMFFLSIISIIAIVWALTPTVMACPLCKEALFDPAQAKQAVKTAKGYALSIGVMLATPALLFGGITAMVVRAQRRKNKKR